MQEVLLAVFGGVVLFFLLVGAAIDMAARIEYAQETFPRLRKLTENRKWRTVLLIATCFFYGGTLYELLREPSAVSLVLANPGARLIEPIIQENQQLRAELSVLRKEEPDGSLRRRTMRLADDLGTFCQARMIGFPSYSSTDPNAAREQQAQNKHIHDTQELCTSKFKVRTAGILQELKGKELDIGMMDKVVEAQGCLGPWGDNSVKELRNLAHWLNADDTVEQF
jgi:hypothetical protein